MEDISQFKKYPPQQLIGRYVKYIHGMSYSSKLNATLCKIISVTKTGFKIDAQGCQDYIFDFVEGKCKGLSGRHNMGVISKCELLTSEQAFIFIEEQKEAKEIKNLVTYVTENVSKLSKGQLLIIKKIIDKK